MRFFFIRRDWLTFALLVAVISVLLALPATAQNFPINRNENPAGANASANAPFTVLPMGVIYGNLAAASGTTGTGEQTLATWAMPAGTLDIVGRRLRITATFGHAANTDSCTPKLYFGSEALATAAGTTSSVGGVIELDVLKTGASTQQVDGHGLGGTAGVTPVILSTTGAETDTSAITIKATQTGGTTGADCSVSNFMVELLN